MNFKLFLSVPLIAMLAACSSADNAPVQKAPELSGRTLAWAASPDADNKPVMTFAEDGSLSGTTGCNLLTGSVSLEGTKIDFSKIGTTKRMCDPKSMEVEQAFIEKLGLTVFAVENGNDVDLLDKDGQLLMKLVDQK